MAKVRTDFVTNSSSSSFIISKDAVAYDQLVEILLEIANAEVEEECWHDNDDEKYTMDDVVDNVVAHRYIITEATPENICEVEYDYFGNTHKYDNHFIINNHGNRRYAWDIVEDILESYNIKWTYGYCD